MCTTVAVTLGSFFFGRNMDIEGSFGERVVITPRNYPFRFRRISPSLSHYAIMGTAAVVAGYPLYADAVNEKGLCAAGLNFPYNAYYPKWGSGIKTEISPFELIPWVLGQCATVAEARELLVQTVLVDEPFSTDLSLTPLHWHIADKDGALVVEPMGDGLKIYDDPVGVLTNNPPFPHQLEQFSRYGELDNRSLVMSLAEPSFFSLGLGGVGIPGDYSSTARYAKAAYLKKYIRSKDDTNAQIAAMFSLLGAVAPPLGCVLDKEGKPHYTTYSCCVDAENRKYYVKKVDKLEVFSVSLDKNDLDGERVISFM